MLISEKIESIEDFSSSYQALADYFLSETQDLDYETSRSIGRKLQISANTVSEFCNDLGFPSFNAFRTAFLKEIDFFNLHFQGYDSEQPFNENENLFATAQSISEIYKDSIIASEDILPKRNLFLASQAIDRAKTIYLVNLTSIQGPTIDFKENMLSIAKETIIENRLNYLNFYVEVCSKEDCFIIISEEDNPDYYFLMEYLRNKGVSVILLTNYGESYMQELTKISLPLVRTERKAGSFASILLKQSMSYMFDVLFANVIKTHYSNYHEIMNLFWESKR